MSSILLYLGTCIIGYIIAIPLRSRRDDLKWISTVQTCAVLVLVCTMGARIGANREVIGNLSAYGLYALIITLAVFVLSIAAVGVARRLMGIDRYGMMQGERKAGADIIPGSGVSEPRERPSRAEIESSEDDASGPTDQQGPEEAGKKEPLFDRTTIMIVIFVIIGIGAGYLICNFIFTDYESFSNIASKIITAGLMMLLLFVGIDLGLDGEVIGSMKRAGIRVFVIPFVIMIGSLGGALICSLFLPITLKEGLAIGAGYGWYSLAPGIIMDAGYISAGAISFMHNVMREILGIVLIPIVARLIGYVECVSLPGAAAMDVCLPIVERSTNGSTAVYSFVSGVVLSIAVPIMVPLFL